MLFLQKGVICIVLLGFPAVRFQKIKNQKKSPHPGLISLEGAPKSTAAGFNAIIKLLYGSGWLVDSVTPQGRWSDRPKVTVFWGDH